MRGLVKVQQINVETGEQRTPRDRLLEMIGGGEGDVATLRAENTQLKTELTAKDEEMKRKDEVYQEEIALLKAQLQKLQPPKEGVPPV